MATTKKKAEKDPFDNDDINAVIDKEFDDIIDLSKVDTKVDTWYSSGVYAFNYICSKNLWGAIPKGRITGIDGLSSTGKTLMASTVTRDPKIDYVVIVESEGGGNSQEIIEFAGVDKRKVRIMKANSIQSYSIDKKSGKIEEVPDDKVPKKKDTEKYRYVEGAGLKIRRFAHSIEFNGIKKNILIIMDSLGNMQSVRGVAGGYDMGKRGVDLTNFFKNFDNEFEKAGLTFLFTNKLYQSLDPNGPSHIATGGEAPQYNSSLYVRLSTTKDSDDISDSDEKEERERRNSALGSSIKTIKAKVIKSRFGTEMRSIPFLFDFSVGPVRLSGLFRLLKDFGVIRKSGNAWYELPEVWEKKFQKKDFVSMVMKDEENLIKKFQELLEKREEEIKEERKNIQVNDFEEVEKIDKQKEEETASADENMDFDADEMMSETVKDMEDA